MAIGATWPATNAGARTPRHVLNHATGFANFAVLEPDGKLRFHFDPGSNYGYSGEGISLLQFGVEKGLGLSVEAELLRMSPPPGERLADKGDQEEGKQGDGQPIVPQEPTHTPTLTLVNCYG